MHQLDRHEFFRDYPPETRQIRVHSVFAVPLRAGAAAGLPTFAVRQG